MYIKEKEEKYLKKKGNGFNKEAYLKKICPFIKNPPSEECYCVKMDSQSIISILKYCANNYSACEIYQKHIKKK